MKKIACAAALLAAGSLCLQDVSTGHGGTYRGPGDVVPQGGGGTGPGGAPPPGPSGPGPAGPAPTTGGPAGPNIPGGITGGPTGPTGVNPTTGGGAGNLGPDLTLWSFWWEFNKDPFLNLQSHIHSGSVTTGSDDFFLGQGEESTTRDSLRPTREQIRQKIVPALLSALESETNNDIVTGCLIALAKIGDANDESGESEFEKVLTGFLADGNQEISETAAIALGILANDASVPTLVALVQDTPDARRGLVKSTEVDYRTRSFAAYGLGLIGARTGSSEVRREIVSVLADVLSKDQSSTRDIAVSCLISLGLSPLETIDPAEPVEDLSTLDPASCRMATIAFLRQYFEDEDNDFLSRAHVPIAITRLMAGMPEERFESLKEELVEEWTEHLGRNSKAQNEIVQSCVMALGSIGDADSDKADEKLRKALIDVPKNVSDIQSRNFSQIALGQVGARDGKDAAGRDDIYKALNTALAKGNTQLRPWVGLGIGVLGASLAEGGSAVSSDLAAAVRDSLDRAKSPVDVGAYSIAVGILRDEESKPIVLEKLDAMRDDEARGYAAVSLGLMDAREAIEPIQGIVRESKYRPELLKQAAIALGLLGDKELVPDLVTMLGEAKGLSTQAAISTALGFIGDSRSIDPLIDMLGNDRITPRARGFAAVALGIVADKEPLPWNSKISVDMNYRAATRTLNDPGGTGVVNIL